jgi:hypothetical protein
MKHIENFDVSAFREESSTQSDTCILMMDNRPLVIDMSAFWTLGAYNNYKYAELHKYDFRYVRPYLGDTSNTSGLCCVNPNTGGLRFAPWAKILAIHDCLKSYKRVIFIDSDALFNTKISIDEFLSNHDLKGKKVAFLTDHPHNPDKPNSGFIICERSQETDEFLRSWFCDQHNEPRFDNSGTWEQASLFHWNLLNVDLFSSCVLLPVNQFKLKNFQSAFSFQKNLDTDPDDIRGNRQIINHYLTKNHHEMCEDILRRYDLLGDYRETIQAIQKHIVELNTEKYSFDSKMSDISVIISGSYIDSQPAITFMQEVIESLELTGIPNNTHIILSHDKLKPDIEGYAEKQEAYNQYYLNLQKYVQASTYTNIEILEAPEWGHLTRTLKYAVSQVKTKYMLVLQHDIHIRREVPVLQMIDLMEKYKHIKHLRFNVRRNHPTFMWWDGYKGGSCLFSEEEYDGVKLCVTPAWSDQNHLATKEYYENVVFPDCTNSDGELIYDFMENRLNGLCHHNHSRYGTYIYGEYGATRTSRHSDGRKSSPEADED